MTETVGSNPTTSVERNIVQTLIEPSERQLPLKDINFDVFFIPFIWKRLMPKL